jgi:hypothetical protein
MADNMSQKILDDQYSRIKFNQSKGIDNSNIASEVIQEVKSEAPRTASQRADGIAQRGKTRAK